MSNYKLDWFKLKIKKQSIKNELLQKKLESSEKPYLKLKLVNDVITVVLKNGEVLSKTSADVIDFDRIKEATTESDILKCFMASHNISDAKTLKDVENQRSLDVIFNSYDILKRIKQFEVSENSVSFKDIDRTIPQMLVTKFANVVKPWENLSDKELNENCKADVEFNSLKRFFMWCCLNPRAEVANELYRFLIDNSFRITKQGFFVALRNVVSLEGAHGDNAKVHFISNTYNKIKAVWKKKPSDYVVLENDGVYFLQKSNSEGNHNGNIIGFLDELYMNLPNMTENRFTDDWTKTFDIRIGRVVSMPMKDCNWSTQDCAASGLHFTADEINYVGCGDTSVLMLINPMKVVGIGAKKGRCYEYLPIMTVPREESTQILHDLDFDTIDLDEQYSEDQLESLVEKAQQGFSHEVNKHQFNLSPISTKQIVDIVQKLNKMKNDLRKRVQEVV